MILEGLCTTTNADVSPHLAAMGATIDDREPWPSRMVLRPFKTARTFANLDRSGEAVFHLTDDVEMIARAALGRFERLPEMEPAGAVAGWILTGTCRWYALRATAVDRGGRRGRFEMAVVDGGRLRDFRGFNRAAHAVIEATILATRTQWIAEEEIRGQMAGLKVLVEKTGGPRERAAMELVDAYLRDARKE